MINKVSQYLSQLACMNLAYATYKPERNKDIMSSSSVVEPLPHSCPNCQNSYVPALALSFLHLHRDDLQLTPSGSPVDVSLEGNRNILLTQQSFSYAAAYTLKFLQCGLHMRESELIVGACLFERLLKQHWQCSRFDCF
jgi:hypothetical protein